MKISGDFGLLYWTLDYLHLELTPLRRSVKSGKVTDGMLSFIKGCQNGINSIMAMSRGRSLGLKAIKEK